MVTATGGTVFISESGIPAQASRCLALSGSISSKRARASRRVWAAACRSGRGQSRLRNGNYCGSVSTAISGRMARTLRQNGLGQRRSHRFGASGKRKSGHTLYSRRCISPAAWSLAIASGRVSWCAHPS